MADEQLNMDELQARLREIQLLVADVDGVLTDGGIYLGEHEELKRYDSRDGSAIKYLMRAGLEFALITGRRSTSVERRARELGVKHVIQGALKKLPALQELLKELGLQPHQAAFIGDDLLDLPPILAVGVGVAVQDAARDVRERADYVTRQPGGRAAVREVVELILNAQGKWAPLVNAYLEQTSEQ